MNPKVSTYLDSLPQLSLEQLQDFFARISFPTEDIDGILTSGRNGIREDAANLSNLVKLQECSVLTFPFEQLDVALGRKVIPEKAFDKLVTHRRGGYCFENNTLMQQVLKTIGFNVRAAPARVIINGIGGKTHLVSIVTFDEGNNDKKSEYLVDIGFGAVTPHKPVNINSIDVPIENHPEVFRIVRDEPTTYLAPGALILQYFDGDSTCFQNAYAVHPTQPVLESDVVSNNFYVSQFPGASNWFTQKRIIVLQYKDGRAVLHNDQLRVVRRKSPVLVDGEKIEMPRWTVDIDETIISDNEYFESLAKLFHIDLSWDNESDAKQVITMESFTSKVLENRYN